MIYKKIIENINCGNLADAKKMLIECIDTEEPTINPWYFFCLGLYYLNFNLNQAYLCFSQGLYYCEDEGFQREIQSILDEIQNSGQCQVAKTAIIIVSYQSCYLLQKTIESIRNTLLKDSYQIIIVDNGSDEETRNYLSTQNDITLILNDTNTGFAHACNQGAALALDSDIFLLNNDTRLADNSLFWLKMGLYEKSGIGACGSVSNYAGNQQQIEQDFLLPSDYLLFGKSCNIFMEDSYTERVRLSGFAMLIKKGLWEKVGGMDEIFSPGYFEDDDLSMKIQKEGFSLLLCKNSYIYHAGSQSFSKRNDLNELLISNHTKFIQKYGFDILEFAYPDSELTKEIPFASSDSFNLLYVGSGLNADLFPIKEAFPKANIICIEPNENLYSIVQKQSMILPSVSDLKKMTNAALFHVLCIDMRRLKEISSEDKTLLSSLCLPNCKIVHAHEPSLSEEKTFEETCNKSSIEKLKDIKLIVWDLDETFWHGTLSEGEIVLPKEHSYLIQSLSKCGIINSISSKNDSLQVKNYLIKENLWDYFVFNNINWNSKGIQIKEKCETMHLRSENVLFIDDNLHNLQDALYHNPGLLAATPAIIPELIAFAGSLPQKDIKLNRLMQYQILEKKTADSIQSHNPTEFLMQCKIEIFIDHNCISNIDRISDLILRSNQLNFTKKRDNHELLLKKCLDPTFQCGCIHVKDRYGDYGIVGFYCYDTQKDYLEHFAFSCRVIGMGIEQYVYLKLGCPAIEVVSPVAVELTNNNTVFWIQEEKKLTNQASHDVFLGRHKKPRILLKGPCDISAISAYLIGGEITTEFNYVNDRGFITAGQNHSLHLKNHLLLKKDEMESLLNQIPFLDYGDFHTSLFEKKYDVICYSLLPDCHSGVYQSKDGLIAFSFGSKNFNLTDPVYQKRYIDGSIQNHGFPFTEKILSNFSKNWNFLDCLSVEQIINNIEFVRAHVIGNPTIILLLGSETEYQKPNEEFQNHHQLHVELNHALFEKYHNDPQIKMVNPTKYIKSQEDYIDCINHYSRNVYYNMATEIVFYINEAFQK